MEVTDVRMFVRHRRILAIHEAGHVIAARIYGIDSSARIWPAAPSNGAPTAGMERALWAGVARMPPSFDKLPRDARRIIGLAGAAAVMLHLKMPPDVTSLVKFMSKPDWKLTGVVPGRYAFYDALRPTLAFTMSYLNRRRPELLALARELIVESRLLNDNVNVVSQLST